MSFLRAHRFEISDEQTSTDSGFETEAHEARDSVQRDKASRANSGEEDRSPRRPTAQSAQHLDAAPAPWPLATAALVCAVLAGTALVRSGTAGDPSREGLDLPVAAEGARPMDRVHRDQRRASRRGRGRQPSLRLTRTKAKALVANGLTTAQSMTLTDDPSYSPAASTPTGVEPAYAPTPNAAEREFGFERWVP
jgi:hypothetical protein